jgi:hypothetical protein
MQIPSPTTKLQETMSSIEDIKHELENALVIIPTITNGMFGRILRWKHKTKVERRRRQPMDLCEWIYPILGFTDMIDT